MGPHVLTSFEPAMSKGWPIWQGLLGCGRHIGTGGHGVLMHETSTRRHVSPSPWQEIAAHGSRHVHVEQPDSSSSKPCGHGTHLSSGQFLLAANRTEQVITRH